MSNNSGPKSRESRPKVGPRHPFWEPSAAQKSTKTGPGTKKCIRKRRQRHFLWCSLAGVVQTRSPDRFLKGPTLQNRVPTTSRSTILTKSPFSKEHRKSRVRASVLIQKMAKNRRRGRPKSEKIAKHMFFWSVKCQIKFCTEKIQKSRKTNPGVCGEV